MRVMRRRAILGKHAAFVSKYNPVECNFSVGVRKRLLEFN